MIRRIFLIVIMSISLTGAAVSSAPVPVLLGMGCLIVIALSMAVRREQQG
jgi:hypothetical protein